MHFLPKQQPIKARSQLFVTHVERRGTFQCIYVSQYFPDAGMTVHYVKTYKKCQETYKNIESFYASSTRLTKAARIFQNARIKNVWCFFDCQNLKRYE